jgi:RNA polymerase sigma factor (sigma-70 family)
MDEKELLRQYVESRSEVAFGELARRYVNLVYSAALRQTGNAALAEDVTQATFLVLARKAHRLRGEVVLSSWLLAVTRYAAKDAIKSEVRRKRHEQKAAAMMPTTDDSNGNRGDEPKWIAVAPLLDDAVASLKEGFRSAIVLRYFERKSYTEIAGQMQITEAAARQRVSRALENLRRYFSGRGIVLSAASLKAMVVAQATCTAPASIGGAAASMGAKALTGAGLTARHAALAQAASIGMIPLGTKLAAVAVIVTVLGTSAMLALHFGNRAGFTASASVKVEDSRSIKGIVLGGDGKPVAGAEVYLAQSNSPITAYGLQNSGVLGVRSGPDGSFELPRTNEATAIVARSDVGYAQTQVEDLHAGGGRVVLSPWARIEGTVQVGGSPRSGETVELFRDGGSLEEWQRWHVMHEGRTKTDLHGHFTFGRVIGMSKGDLHGPAIRWKPAGSLEDPRTYVVNVECGKTAQVTIGGDGVTVSGRIDTRGKGLPAFNGILSPLLTPPVLTTQPTTQMAVRRARQIVIAPITFVTSGDGSFRVVDVPPGEYRLDLRSWMKSPHVRSVQELASVQTEVVVPEVSGSLGDKPVDLGVLTAHVNRLILPGENIPDFSAVLADDTGTTPIHFTDFRGRVVLLCRENRNWTAPAASQVADNLNLNGLSLAPIFDRFGTDPRLAILELTGARSVEDIRKYREMHGVPWLVAGAISLATPQPASQPSGWDDPLGSYDSSPIRFFVVDGEGRVLARCSNAGEVYGALDRALPGTMATTGAHVEVQHVAGANNDASNSPGTLSEESDGNIARTAKFSIVAGRLGASSGTAGVLHDGLLPMGDDEPMANLGFDFTTLEGRVEVDLGKTTAIQRINAYSRHKSDRGPQVYIVYGSNGTTPGFDANPGIGIDPGRHGWTRIAAVDSRPSKGVVGGRYKTSIANGVRPLGEYRYVLFAMFVTETNDDWGHTFFSEIEVIKQPEGKL